MNKNFLDLLARHVKAGELEKLDSVAQKLDALSQQLAAILGDLSAPCRQDLLARFDAEVRASLKGIEANGAGSAPVRPDRPQSDSNSAGPAVGTPTPPKQEPEFQAGHITPEMREWARLNKEILTPEFIAWAMQDFDLEKALASYREVLETGGLELKDFIQELEQLAAQDE